MSSPIPQFVIIADDLTGSLDTGLQFRKKGLTTLVPLQPRFFQLNAQALVLNTNTRNLPGNLAYEKVFRICRSIKADALYKKIDSTMRGNVGWEALAVLDAQNISKAIIAPAIPELGRTVEKGILRVKGVPLLRTSYARDPFHPLWTSRISVLLRKETGLPVGHISLKEIRTTPTTLAEKIEKSPERLLVLDAARLGDLQCIASACRLLSGRALACGSVGLAQELVRPSPREKKAQFPRYRGAILIISASRNPGTAEQIRETRRHLRMPILEPNLIRLTHPKRKRLELDALSHTLLKLISEDRGAILTTTFQSHLPGKEKEIAGALGKIAVQILQKAPLSGLVLTGGDLATGVCDQLGTSALRIEEEVLPGIPCSTLMDGPFQGLRLITKAGGFGEKNALWRIIQYLKGNHENPKS